jgi:hypothetical protein
MENDQEMQAIRDFLTDEQWHIVIDAIEQEAFLLDESEEYFDKCEDIINRIHSLLHITGPSKVS